MNVNYSNDPRVIGKYFSNSSLLLSSSNRLQTVDPFTEHIIPSIEYKKEDNEIMKVKPRSTVPEQFQSIGTKISKSCNLPGITIDRFENPLPDIQNPMHIIAKEPFRGGMPSRIVMKDEYVKSMGNK